MAGLAAFFESYYRLRPVSATFTGVHTHDDALPDWSPSGLEAARDEMGRVRTALIAQRAADEQAADISAMHDDVSARDRELAISFLDVQLAEDVTRHFQRGNPSLAVGEAAFGVVSLITRPFAPAAVRASALARRLDAMPAFLAGAQQSIGDAVPPAWRIKALTECEGLDVLLRGGVACWIDGEAIDASLAGTIERGAVRARAALADFRTWLSRRRDDGRGECGRELFELLLARGHWCTERCEELARRAADELDAALAVLDARARAAGGWPEVQQRLATAHPSLDDYLPAFGRTWNACRALADARDLVTWPDAPIQYAPIPPHTRDAAPYLYYLFYRSPAPFDRLPIHDYLVTPIDASLPPDEQRKRLRAANASVIKLNHVVHHGSIGHHVQNHHAYAGASEIGRVAAVDCACRIGMFLGGTMAEGWACYATDLMDEAGFLTGDESIAQQHTRARLLARAVVDLGFHLGSLTFDDAVSVYRDRIGMPPEAAAAEACKNSMFPGTALMYWLGTAGLHDLRRDRERREGAAFSLRRFHDRVLSFGSIPVSLLARLW